MLSGVKIGGRHVNYYCAYVAAGGPPGVWLGQGPAALGLGQGVDEGAFRALAKGMAPDGSGPLVRLQANHTMGWDFTFSAPKSVSLLMALHPDEAVRAAVRSAHDEAVEAALGYLEDHGGRSRRGLGGRDGHVKASLVVAGFFHTTSRERDPQLHTHCLVLNVGLGSDGRWATIDSRFLFKRRMAAGAIYRAELRQRLSAMGARWAPPDSRGLSEMVGIERETLRHFSKRRVEIERQLESWGLSGPVASEAATLSTRATKVEVEWAELSAEWRARAQAQGLSPEVLAALMDGSDSREELSGPERARTTEALLGPGGLTATQAAFRRDDVVRAWAASRSQGASRAELEALCAETLGRAEIVPLVVADADGHVLSPGQRSGTGILRLVPRTTEDVVSRTEARFTTAELLGVEAGLVADALAMRGSGAGRVRAGALEAALASSCAESRGLSAEQEAMVGRLCSSGDGVEVVVGVPGSGKSFALGVARAAWEASGHRVIGCALAAEAAAHLEEAAGIASTTLESLLMGLDGPRVGALDRSCVVVVDEAAMVDTRRLGRLVDHAREAGAKVVLVGDDRQVAAVEVGGAFAGVADRLGASHLVANGRQVEAWEREALAAIRDGRVDEAATAYVDHGRVVVIDDPAGLAEATVDGWWASVQSGADAAMYAYRRHQVAALNASGRAKMAEARRLSGPELVFAASPGGDLVERRYQAGDELVLLRNRRRLGKDASGKGVRNGTRATVVSVDPDAGSATVCTTDGRVLRLPRAYLERHSDYGYALTVHKAQGKTLGQAARLGAEDPRLRGEAHVYAADDLSAEAALVGASRAADSSTLYLLSAPEPAPEDHGEPEQREPEVALASGWSRREAKVMAMDELERLRRVEVLAVEEPREALVAQRQVLAAVAQGAGPGPGPAEHRVASALAVLPEVVEAEVAVKASLEAEAEAGRQARVAALAEAGRSRSELEDEATLAAMEAEGAERRQARVGDARAAWGTDVVAAHSELGLLDEALSTQRRRRLDALAAEPPAYVVDLLGTRPTETAAALRWRQGMGLIEDVRRAGGVRREGVGGRWEVALGPIPTERVARARYGRAVAALEGVRADLGLGEGDRRPQQPDAEGAHHRDRRDRRRRLRAEDDRARRGRRDRGWGLER